MGAQYGYKLHWTGCSPDNARDVECAIMKDVCRIVRHIKYPSHLRLVMEFPVETEAPDSEPDNTQGENKDKKSAVTTKITAMLTRETPHTEPEPGPEKKAFLLRRNAYLENALT